MCWSMFVRLLCGGLLSSFSAAGLVGLCFFSRSVLFMYSMRSLMLLVFDMMSGRVNHCGRSLFMSWFLAWVWAGQVKRK